MKFRDATKLQIPSSYSEWTCLSWYGDFYNDYPEGGPFPNAQISGSLGPDVGPPGLSPTVSIADSSVVEGDSGTSMMRFTVTLGGGAGPSTVTVSFRTVDGTASAASDYTAASGTLAFPPGVFSRTITTTVNGDHKREPNETFTVELFNPIAGTIGDALATATILNDDLTSQ